MLATIVIAIVFFAVVGWSAYRSYKSMKNNSCPGCSGGCTIAEREKCSK